MTEFSQKELIDTAELLWQAGIPAVVANRQEKRTTYAKKWERCCDNIPSQARQDEFRTLLRDGYNTVAIATGFVIDGKRLVAVDVDDPRLVRFAKLMVPSPSHRFGSKGTGLFCWADKSDEFFKKKQTATIHGHSRAAIELLTRLQNLIVPPSFHPKTGKLYKWTGKPIWECLDELPTLTHETWAIIEAVVGHHSEHAGGQTVEPLLDGEATHDAGLTLVAKLVGLCDDDQIRDIIFALLPEAYQGNTKKEVDGWIRDARRKSMDSGSHASTGVPDETIKRLAEFNEVYCVTRVGGSTLVLEKSYDDELMRHCYIYQRFADFKNYHIGDNVEFGSNAKGKLIEKPIAEAWLKWSDHTKASRVVFLPDQASGIIELGGRTLFNLWSGFSETPAEGQWPLFREHLRDTVCSGDQEYFDYLMGWLAYCVKYPERPAEVAVVMRGGMGTGKGTLGRLFGSLFGQHFIHATNPRHVVGNFNQHLRDCAFLFADEAIFAGDPKMVSHLKGLITEPTILVEQKFVDVVPMANRLSIMMATNADWAIPAGPDERRFFVVDVAETHKQDRGHFEAIYDEMDGGGLAAMLYELLHMNLTNFTITTVPQTTALSDQKRYSLDSVPAFALHILERSHQLPHPKEWMEWCPTSELWDEYVDYTDKARRHRLVASNQFCKQLYKLLGCSHAKKRRKKAGEIGFERDVAFVHGVGFPTLDASRDAYDTAVPGVASTTWQEAVSDGDVEETRWGKNHSMRID